MTDVEKLIKDAARMAVAEIEQNRAEERRAAAREEAKLVAAAREVLGDERVPRAGEAREARPKATAPPDWAAAIGLSEEESRETAGAPLKWSSESTKVPR